MWSRCKIPNFKGCYVLPLYVVQESLQEEGEKHRVEIQWKMDECISTEFRCRVRSGLKCEHAGFWSGSRMHSAGELCGTFSLFINPRKNCKRGEKRKKTYTIMRWLGWHWGTDKREMLWNSLDYTSYFLWTRWIVTTCLGGCTDNVVTSVFLCRFIHDLQ